MSQKQFKYGVVCRDITGEIYSYIADAVSYDIFRNAYYLVKGDNNITSIAIPIKNLVFFQKTKLYDEAMLEAWQAEYGQYVGD